MPLTAIPTAAGREHQVISWVEAWVAQRPALAMQRDDAGNLLIGRKGAGSDEPLVVTAHMDHPAFVVESVGREQVELSFRGSVNDPYFEDARIELSMLEPKWSEKTIDQGKMLGDIYHDRYCR